MTICRVLVARDYVELWEVVWRNMKNLLSHQIKQSNSQLTSQIIPKKITVMKLKNDLEYLMNFHAESKTTSSARQWRRKNKLIEFNGVMKIISSPLELWMAQNYITLARLLPVVFRWVIFISALSFLTTFRCVISMNSRTEEILMLFGFMKN